MVPIGIGKEIPEGITELKIIREGVGVSIPEGILEKESPSKIIFDLFLKLINKLSSDGELDGEFCTESSENNVELST